MCAIMLSLLVLLPIGEYDVISSSNIFLPLGYTTQEAALTLTAVMGDTAIVEVGGSGHYLKVGEEVGGARLLSIYPNSIMMWKDGRTKWLDLKD